VGERSWRQAVRDRPRKPAAAPAEGDLPYPLTFFLSARDRARVLRALAGHDGDRARALLVALGLRRKR